MEKKMYETPEVEVIMLNARDAIMDSASQGDDNQEASAPRRGHRDMWNEE